VGRGKAGSEGPAPRAGDAQHGRAAASAEPGSPCCPQRGHAAPPGFVQNTARIYLLSCSAVLAWPASSPPEAEQKDTGRSWKRVLISEKVGKRRGSSGAAESKIYSPLPRPFAPLSHLHVVQMNYFYK